jgi:hypothetical protein
VTDAHREAEGAVAQIDVLNVRDAGRQPLRELDAQAAELEVVAGAHEVQHAVARIYIESHGHAGGKRLDQRSVA